MDELEMHQPTVTDASTLRGYRQDIAVSKFLSGLSPPLRSQMRGQMLGGDSISVLAATFSRVMQVSTGFEASSAPSIEQSVMIFGSGRGRGRGRDFGGRGRRFIGGGCGSYGSRQSAFEKAPSNVGIVDLAITSPKSAGRNLNVLSGHSYLILVLLPYMVLLKVHLLFLTLPWLNCRRRSMIDSDS